LEYRVGFEVGELDDKSVVVSEEDCRVFQLIRFLLFFVVLEQCSFLAPSLDVLNTLVDCIEILGRTFTEHVRLDGRLLG